jgi:hypothetical protein
MVNFLFIYVKFFLMFYLIQIIISDFFINALVKLDEWGVELIELVKIYLVPSLVLLVPTQERIGIGFTGF